MKGQQKRKIQQCHPEIEDGTDLRRWPPVLLYNIFRKSVLIELYRILHWVAPSCCPGGYLSYHFQQCFYHLYHIHNRGIIYVFFTGGSPRFPLRPSHSRSKRQCSGSLQRRSKKVKSNILYLFYHNSTATISNRNKLHKSSGIIIHLAYKLFCIVNNNIQTLIDV